MRDIALEMAGQLEIAESLRKMIAEIKFEDNRRTLSDICSTFDEYTFDKLLMLPMFRCLIADGVPPTLEQLTSKYLARYSEKLLMRRIKLTDNIPYSERIEANGATVPICDVSYGDYATARIMRSYAEFISQYYGYHFFRGTSRHVASGLTLALDSTALDLTSTIWC